jgi:poly(3-hydroxybutyrate) depolymerase
MTNSLRDRGAKTWLIGEAVDAAPMHHRAAHVRAPHWRVASRLRDCDSRRAAPPCQHQPETNMKLPQLRAWAGALGLASFSATAAVSLPALNVDPAGITVSGLSSGGVMAINLGYAYSATFRGVGIFAATPYLCQYHYHYTSCQNKNVISQAMLDTMQASIDSWSGGVIDSKANVATQKIYLFTGKKDNTVGVNPMLAVQDQYADNGVPSVTLVQAANVGHVFPTDFNSTGNNPCSTSLPPYISNCSYDGAKAALTQFYGTLLPRNNAPAAANYREFDQREFTANMGMSNTGWVYVPASCAAGTQCKLHVALHGCTQDHATIGTKFVKNTGYTRWADTNNMIVLFPQARADLNVYPTVASGMQSNANACWDTVGFYGANYAQKSGAQLSAIKAMVDRLRGL